jgi:hypothetical protein
MERHIPKSRAFMALWGSDWRVGRRLANSFRDKLVRHQRCCMQWR